MWWLTFGAIASKIADGSHLPEPGPICCNATRVCSSPQQAGCSCAASFLQRSPANSAINVSTVQTCMSALHSCRTPTQERSCITTCYSCVDTQTAAVFLYAMPNSLFPQHAKHNLASAHPSHTSRLQLARSFRAMPARPSAWRMLEACTRSQKDDCSSGCTCRQQQICILGCASSFSCGRTCTRIATAATSFV